MSDAGEELNEFATELERHALKLPRPLAIMVLAVAAARIAGDAPEAERERILAHHKRGWDGTMAGYGHEIGAAVNPANSTNPRGGDNG